VLSLRHLHGATFGPVILDTPIGGKEVSITLKNRYQLEWRQYGKFWFLEGQGRADSGALT